MLRSPNEPPTASKRPTISELWNDTRQDDYAWMADREDPEVLALLKKENEYSDAAFAEQSELVETIYHEIKDRVKETDLSVPVRKDQWSYYSRTEESKNYGIHCRRRLESSGEPTGDEQILLDENLEAAEGFFELGLFEVSIDHSRLLWAYDTVGDERFAIEVRDLASGKTIDTALNDVAAAGTAWTSDGQSFFYVRPDDLNRPYQVWHHVVGQRADEDQLIYTENDERFFVSVNRDKDDSHIYISSSSRVSDEVRIIPADDPLATPRVVLPREDEVEYSVSHHEGSLIMLTNRNAPNFKVMSVHLADVGQADTTPDAWAGLVEVDPEITISDFDILAGHLVLFERKGGFTRIRTRRWSDGKIRVLDQPESVSTVWPGANVDPKSDTLRFGYTSLVTPSSVFEVDLQTEKRTLLKQQEVLGEFRSEDYQSERIWASSADGTEVPVSLVWKKDRVPEGPAVLYAYGAYEASIDPSFSIARLSLLDRGFLFAVAHVRGGGEMGRQWHLDGKYEKKVNTFDDAIAAAETLISNKLTTADQLAIRGGSAGGLLVGAVLNKAPGLFGAAVAEVPFVDTLTTMLDTTLPLTVTEFEEWGNPAESEEIYRSMKGYSPNDNVLAAKYPAVYATAGLHDTRVSFWEPLKWVQLLRQASTSSNPVLLWTQMDAGHQGPSGRYDAWKQEAKTLGFIVSAI